MADSSVRRKLAESAVRIRSYADLRFGSRESFRVVTPVGDVDLAKQSFKDECDINVIMRRYQASGVLPGMERAAGARYMDCRGADYQEAMLLVSSARSMFADLPAKIRDRFKNDPSLLMAFLEDDRNLDEARELGLVNRAKEEATPLAVRVVESPVAHPSETSGVVPAAGPTADVPPGVVRRKP